ncbi:uncharacterized protein LOC119656507 [Hermetia illucens]|uniref:uncharacterized protein LOC119656507 n=1 Tax=Hermetia illucens TaxID=343691 RepID=UPI0018CC2A8F|nr:uncharacterized protein LOC119656507 [Hermetia illucens]
MIALAVAIIFVLYLLKVLYSKWKVFNYILSNFSSPPRHPVFGILHLFPSDSPGIFRTFQELVKNYGRNFVVSRPIFDALIAISDPADIETILSNPNTKTAKKARLYDTLKPWLGSYKKALIIAYVVSISSI